jgi:predicted acylesterase/phospholipase RssA
MNITSTTVPNFRTAPEQRLPHLGPAAPAPTHRNVPGNQPERYIAGAGAAANIKEILGATYTLAKHADIIGVVGTSAGCLATAGLAMGVPEDQAEAEVVNLLQKNRILDISPFAWGSYGLCRWEVLRDTVAKIFGKKAKLGDANIPMAVVVSDVYTRQPVVFSSWATPQVLLIECLPASSAIPFLAAAQKIPSAGTGNRLYCDGGVADNFALDVFADKRAPTVGLCLDRQMKHEPKRIGGLRDYIIAVAELALWESGDVSARDDDRVVPLQAKGSGFNFNQTPDEIKAGIQHGRQQVLDAIAAGLLG